jgi:hypothetical protein
MLLDARGHPLHTRALSITLTQEPADLVAVEGVILDLRKRGFVPVGGHLQTSGIVHHMRLDGVVDPRTRVLESIRCAQPTVAFEPNAVTGGESCRDPIAAVEALAGATLDAEFARHVSAALGGPRGCNHVLTLAHLLGSTTAWALEEERGAGLAPARVPGDRVFRRDLVIDGHEEGPDLLLALQVGDLHLRSASPTARPMERFGTQRELRVLLRLDLRTFTIVHATGATRRRTLDTLADAGWAACDEALGAVLGLQLGAGITSTLLARFGDTPEDRPLLDGLLMLAPAVVQCMAAMSESWPLAAVQRPTVIGMGGLPDSCYMWRRGGALLRARDHEAGPSGR